MAIYLVGTDPRESIDTLEADRREMGYPWPVAYAEEDMLESLRIYSQPSKVAFTGDGVISHRYGFGKGDFESWEALFDDISAQ